MSENIGLKGILEGIKNMLVTTDKDTVELLKTKMQCAKSMLEGVIKELEPLTYSVGRVPENSASSSTFPLDPEANKAKEELS